MLNTVSVTTTPPAKVAIDKPMTVSTGIMALRSACRRTTRRPGNPFERAVRT